MINRYLKTFCTFVGYLCAAPAFTQAVSANETIALFDHSPGIRIDLIAAEPTVIDPVAIAWDENGTLYVVENGGYPTGPGEGKPPAGCVVTLSDSDGDARYDERSLFADGLEFPNGIMPWRGGVLVTDAPYLLHFIDTDNDGRADKRTPVLEGFAPGGSTQLRVSHPTLGPDNWLYLTNGLSGGDIRITKLGGEAVTMGANDLRYDPIHNILETTAGRAQFGLTFDDAGNKFICSNRNHVQHVVLQPRDVTRNPYSPFRQTVNDIPEHGAAAKLYPISENMTTAYSHIGTFTAACGLVVYRGNALPDAYYGNAFVCDPTGNLVHRDIMEKAGITFVGHRGEKESEFLRSTDNWFRPVFLANGPDGALYLCDMYRETIEHPRYLPADLAARTDFEAGKDRGRIYRISAADDPPHAIEINPFPDNLARTLDHGNNWMADTAQRLLLNRMNETDVAALHDVVRASSRPSARMRALNLFQTFGELTQGTLRTALADRSPVVRRVAYRIARSRMADEEAFRVAAVRDALRDSDPACVLEGLRAFAAIAVSGANDEEVKAIAAVARRGDNDSWLRGAFLSAAHGYAGPIMRAEGIDPINDPRIIEPFMQEIAHLEGPEAAADLVFATEAADAAVKGALKGLAQQDRSVPAVEALIAASNVENATRLKDLRDSWIANANDAASAAMLRYADPAVAGPALAEILRPDTPEDVQVAAIESIATFSDDIAIPALNNETAWESYTPRSREAAVIAMLMRKQRIDALLERIAEGGIRARTIPALQRNRLLRSGNTEIKARATELFASVNAGRAEAIAAFKEAATLQGDAAKGQVHYEKICASCHVFQENGFGVGPELSDIRAKTADTILLHVLDPNRELTSGYETCEVETIDGDTYTGILTSDSAAGITLTQAYAKQVSVPRKEIAAVRTAPLSLMPEGLEQGLTPQDLADLIAYLRRDI